jgi:F0F1-type ATP synthase delta subunit
MTSATEYARALFAAANEHPHMGTKLLTNLRTLLERRGHGKLLPRILSEYEKLFLKEERVKRYKSVTPESERTRQLLELYQKLIHTH